MRAKHFTHVVAVTAATLVAVTACGNNAPPAEPGDEEGSASSVTLTVYHSEEGFDVLSERFAQDYVEATGTEVIFESFHQAGGELRAAVELEAQSGSINGDVMIAEISELVGLQERYDPFLGIEIPAEYEIPEQLSERASEYGFMPYALSPFILVYNDELVTGDEIPDSWLDILDGRWENLIGLGDPETTSGAHAPLWFIIEKMKDTPGFGWEYYERLGELNPTTASSHGAIYEQIAGGELQVGLLSYPGLVGWAGDGMPLDGVVPTEGAPSLFTVAGVFSDSDTPDVATAFVEWLASENGQTALQDGQIPYLPVRTDVEPRTSEHVTVEVPVEAIYPIDPVWVSQQRDENVQQFRERIG